MSHITSKDEAEKYLELFRTHENKYIIGIYQTGITIYKQQIRALNIFHCLHLTKRLQKDSSVAIIGGGISGMTFAAAALRTKINTHIFEKYPSYIPIQSDCNNREIHPHIYDWPLPGSTNPDAELPILNWENSTTGVFCNRVKKEFGKIKESFKSDGFSYQMLLHEYFDCQKIERIDFDATEKKYVIAATTSDLQIEVKCDIIIYAIGYGLEQSFYDKKKTPSYWRDINTHQINLLNTKYLISGTGDGALMDLFTILIEGCKYETLVSAINSNDHGRFLINQFIEFRKEFFANNHDEDFLFNKFEKIDSKICDDIVRGLSFRATEVVLNGQKDFKYCLNPDKVSILNAFVAYILYKKKCFSFIPGDLEYDVRNAKCSISGHSTTFDGYEYLFRHGTDREGVLKAIPNLYEEFLDNKLREKQKESLKDGLIKKTWSDEQLNQIFQRAHYDQIEKISGNALPILECYTNILSSLFSKTLNKSGNFRIALQKVVETSDGKYFVQITPYAGVHNTFKGGFGKLFSAKIGNVGYSIHTSKPSLLILSESKKSSYQEFLVSIGITQNDEIEHRKSYFTLPILAPVEAYDKNKRQKDIFNITNLVLYIDSSESNFFNQKVLDTILDATSGFVKTFEDCHEKQQFLMDDHDYEFTVNDNRSDNLVYKSEFFNQTNKVFKEFVRKWESAVNRNEINFTRFHSFTFSRPKRK